SIGSLSQEQSQGVKSQPHQGGGAIAVPPGPVPPPIGHPPYPDGSPCVGTPKDPTRFPDKSSNPCDGKPVKAEPPGPMSLPIGYPPYPDGSPCVGTPKDPTRFPDRVSNPCMGTSRLEPGPHEKLIFRRLQPR
ncbi:MAG TPA: hypothetical protein V6D17_13240, partial [Candidatus Obscuribacterales bacterium]